MRLASTPNVTVERARMPHDWPSGRFDLVVVGELGYYLPDDDLRRLAETCRASLTRDGTLVACHWRRTAPDMLQRAETVHAELLRATGLRTVCHYEDDDFLLDVWTPDGRSVAQCEGLA
jgi:hypothetical protein